MSIACWITKGTNIHSEYVTLIAFLRQAWLHERASVSLYMYIACLVYFPNILEPCYSKHEIDIGSKLACRTTYLRIRASSMHITNSTKYSVYTNNISVNSDKGCSFSGSCRPLFIKCKFRNPKVALIFLKLKNNNVCHVL